MLKPMTTLTALHAQASQCTACGLCHTRQQVVFGGGNPQARIMLIGEAPGQQEDEQGQPFVGRAGQLLTQLLAQAGIDRQQHLYIANVLKCRPPANRVPTPEEANACKPLLQAQIALIKPSVLVLAGGTALRHVLGLKTPITQMRGQWLPTPFNRGQTQAMGVFHPSYLLRNHRTTPNSPRWLMLQDLQAIKAAAQL
jgi:uracil-DNA glycosylase